MTSTLLVQCLSRKQKVIICDFFGAPWSLGTGEPIALVNKEQSYDKFRLFVDRVMSQSHNEFIKEREEKINYLIYPNEKRTVKKIISSIL